MRLKACLVVALSGLACGSSQQGSSSTAGSSQGAGTTTGGSPGTTSTAGTSGTTGGSGTGGSSTGGNSTGGTTGSPPLVDGGYVFCTLPNAADAGPNGDGGTANWFCQPGTYFCDSSGNIGDCLQCRSDGDCTDQSLATYDSARRRCDIDSGVAGYQGFCQECLGDTDCNGNPAGPDCQLDSGAAVPTIDLLGYETCAPAPRPGPPDCRSDPYLKDGGCLPSFTCSTDQDCAGLISQTQVLVPFCVNGSCASCDGGLCPGAGCYQDSDCQIDYGFDAGVTCNPAIYRCGCTGNEQCGGFWPLCLGLDAGALNSEGQPVGLCACDRDDECGGGGLRCLGSLTTAGGVCGISCLDPQLPACIAFKGEQSPFCDPSALICEECGSDGQCKTQRGTQITGPYCRLDGACGCQVNGDCPAGEICAPPYVVSSDQGHIGLCEPLPPRCTPASCTGELCDADGGCEVGVQCASNYDCTVGRIGVGEPLCDVDAGLCVDCAVDADCVREGYASGGSSFCNASYCSPQCATDQDCAGNVLGSSCLTNVNAQKFCGCGTDQECTGNPEGSHCDTKSSDEFYGSCACFSGSECPAGTNCQLVSGTTALCRSDCSADLDCPSGFYCDPYYTCRPRCEPGKSCAAPDTVCDTDNVVGLNSNPDSGSVEVWCYPCLTASDCAAGQACGADTDYYCGTCSQSSDCRSSETCVNQVCHPSCDAGACPAGELCDSLGLVGYGVDVCYECIGPQDCPGGLGCDSLTHTCGNCVGPTANGGPYDCPPDAICSSYWSRGSGVCLQNCDERVCPLGQTCELFASISPDHKYCFGCLQDSDCAGTGAWCDTSVGPTFTCQPAP